MKTKKFLETLLAGLTCLSFWSGTGEAADAQVEEAHLNAEEPQTEESMQEENHEH